MSPTRRPPRPRDLRYPQLVPYALVLPRATGEVQVGIDPGAALVFHGDGFRAVLELLDGRHGLAVVRERARTAGISPPQLDATLAALLDAGLLTDRDGERAGPASLARVRLVGAGPIGRQVALTLVDSGLRTLYVFDDEPPEPGLYPTAGVLGSRALALCSVLQARSSAVASAVNHWSKPEASAVDLTVIAADTVEVDRLLTEHLVRTDQPHLLVRGHSLGVGVGPLVQPGRTSCLRCADLSRRDADPPWPTVLTQLTRINQQPPPALLCWAAAVATVQALAFLGGGTAQTAGATLELDGRDHAMRLRSWPPHPECGCGWGSPTEWGHD